MLFPASPPTRGWTPQLPLENTPLQGFPAHAGMDRDMSCFGLPYARLPRPRGDGPGTRSRGGRRRRASPPTRGWTHPSAMPTPGPRGFPAHAGMDPDGSTGSGRKRGLPRPRGDGPAASGAEAAVLLASPPTRGWTRDVAPRAGVRNGFPAHAGMDRWATFMASRMTGLPRPRGDGPARRISV